MNDHVLYLLMEELSFLSQMGAYLFLVSHLLKKRLSLIAILAVEFAVQLIIRSYCSLSDAPAIVTGVLQYMLSFAVIIFFFEGKIKNKLIIYICQSLNSVVVAEISTLLLKIVCGIEVSATSNEVVRNSLGALVTSDLLMIVVLSICWIIMKKKNNSKTKIAVPQIRIFLLILVIHYIFLLVHFIGVDEADIANLFMEYIFQSIIYILLYLQYFISIRNKELIQENHLLSVKQSISDNEKKYYELAQSKFDDISKIRHDLNNKVNIARQFILSDQKKEAQEVINNISESLNEIKAVQYCSNPLINTILTTKANESEYKNIDMQFVMKDCEYIPCDTADLCSLFSNLFDNAAKAAISSGISPVLQMESRAVNEYFVLKITNTARPGALIEKEKNRAARQAAGHGYGLSIIDMIAKKYDGNFSIEQNDSFVTAAVMLKYK